MENQLLWIKSELDSPPAVPPRRGFDWPSREKKLHCKKVIRTWGLCRHRKEHQTINEFIGRFLSFRRKESVLNTLLERHCSVTVIHNLISGSQFRKVSNWESLMKCLVVTSEVETSIRSRQIHAWSQSPNSNPFLLWGETESKPLAV